jgi:hypothetical protein
MVKLWRRPRPPKARDSFAAFASDLRPTQLQSQHPYEQQVA